jgi:hypothetical protein
MLSMLNRGDDSVLREKHQAGRALSAVKAVRDVVRECLMVPDRWNEYFIALSLLSLRLMDWKSETLDARRLAFLVSALSLAAVRSPRDMQSKSDQNWIDTTTDIDKTDIQPGVADQ